MTPFRRRALGWSLAWTIAGVLALATASPAAAAPPDGPEPTTPIRHLVVVMQDNHSFDNYFGTYPGANGIPPGTCVPRNPNGPGINCVEPFHLDGSVRDLDDNADTFQAQYRDGRMDGFVQALSNQPGEFAMGYYDDRDVPYYWNLADQFVLFDRFFSSSNGSSFNSHMAWVAAAPGPERDGVRPSGVTGLPTIFDRLQARGVSWRFYAQNYNPKITYRAVESFRNASPRRPSVSPQRLAQVVRVPLLSMNRFINKDRLSRNIVDVREYFSDVQRGTLPAVSFVTPAAASEHPPGSLEAGQRFVGSLIHALVQSDLWESSALVLTYNHWGGWYDHVKPPQIGRGYGFRVPTLLVSAYARQGYIDHRRYDHASILRFIEENYGLRPLTSRDANASSIARAFDFESPPRPPTIVPFNRAAVLDEPRPSSALLYVSYGSVFAIAGLALLAPLLRGATKAIVAPLRRGKRDS
jgi:phospholipase C